MSLRAKITCVRSPVEISRLARADWEPTFVCALAESRTPRELVLQEMMGIRAESSTAASNKVKAVQESAADAGYELPW